MLITKVKLTAKIFSCNWETYKKIINKIIKQLCEKESLNFEDYEICLEKIELKGETIQKQRNSKGEWSRTIFLYFDNDLKYLIALSNTNWDEDKLIESNKLNKKSKYGIKDYHANTYLMQGINKNFEVYYNNKKIYPNLKMFFYALDVNESYPHNLTNLMVYKKLATIGFDLLNLNEINFKELKEIDPTINTTDIQYTSLNKFINDTIVVSKKNTGNMPSYMKIIDYDYDISEDEKNKEESEIKKENKKYIYTFKSLGAETYDSFLTMWTLIILAQNEDKKLEFFFSPEVYNLKDSKKIKKTKQYAGSITSFFEKNGIEIKYESTDEIRQQLEREKSQFEIARSKKKLRNQELFKNNMREKGLPTKCCLCGCEIENILEAAHLWGVAEIKNAAASEINKTIKNDSMKDLIDETNPYHDDIFYKRYVMANSGDNGIWLCKNHHGLFDNHFYCFDSEDGKIIIDIKKLAEDTEARTFFELITKIDSLSKNILTDKTKIFLQHNQINEENKEIFSLEEKNIS